MRDSLQLCNDNYSVTFKETFPLSVSGFFLKIINLESFIWVFFRLKILESLKKVCAISIQLKLFFDVKSGLFTFKTFEFD